MGETELGTFCLHKSPEATLQPSIFDLFSWLPFSPDPGRGGLVGNSGLAHPQPQPWSPVSTGRLPLQTICKRPLESRAKRGASSPLLGHSCKNTDSSEQDNVGREEGETHRL